MALQMARFLFVLLFGPALARLVARSVKAEKRDERPEAEVAPQASQSFCAVFTTREHLILMYSSGPRRAIDVAAISDWP